MLALGSGGPQWWDLDALWRQSQRLAEGLDAGEETRTGMAVASV